MIQKGKLEFKLEDISIPQESFKQLVKKIALENKWTIYSQTNHEVILKTNPGFVNQSWGQNITIRHSAEGILINSINDINKGPRLTAFGQNFKNIDEITRIIEESNLHNVKK
ncbi:hypothetical protein [Fulvivirga ligni]|uniref:hypothetical protein n=1 Tax=Fulvivirga ligni TaxID=2904246 RepID=UPI001F2A4894|nr:hypothetical protein [Fulvivirga ligni]UII20512.1 hypothetical protein LVD16_21980 [Fulvivirga ligni]